jgi:hypothetical protein
VIDMMSVDSAMDKACSMSGQMLQMGTGPWHWPINMRNCKKQWWKHQSPRRLISSLSHSHFVSPWTTKLIETCLLELSPTTCKNRCKVPCHVGLDVKHAAHKVRSRCNLEVARLKDDDDLQQGCSNHVPYNHATLDAASIH